MDGERHKPMELTECSFCKGLASLHTEFYPSSYSFRFWLGKLLQSSVVKLPSHQGHHPCNCIRSAKTKLANWSSSLTAEAALAFWFLQNTSNSSSSSSGGGDSSSKGTNSDSIDSNVNMRLLISQSGTLHWAVIRERLAPVAKMTLPDQGEWRSEAMKCELRKYESGASNGGVCVCLF